MATCLVRHRHGVLVIPDRPDAKVICRPLPADQLQRLVREPGLLAGLFLPLGIIQHEGLIQVIELRHPF